MTTRTRWVVYACLLPILFTLTCWSGSPGTKAGTVVKSYGPVDLTENARIVGNKLSVVMQDTELVNGLLKVQLTVQNVTPDHLEFEYRYTWFDEKGFEIKSPSSTWRSVQVYAKDEAYLSGVAPNEAVTDFKFVVRYPDRW